MIQLLEQPVKQVSGILNKYWSQKIAYKKIIIFYMIELCNLLDATYWFSVSFLSSTMCAPQCIVHISQKHLCLLYIVPSAPPSEVRADGMSITISVQWEMVPCIDQNGAITSYSVRYVEAESGSTQTVSTTERQLVISGVSTSTNYSVEVAAVNSAGTGVYSSPIFATTDSETIFTLPVDSYICYSQMPYL